MSKNWKWKIVGTVAAYLCLVVVLAFPVLRQKHYAGR